MKVLLEKELFSSLIWRYANNILRFSILLGLRDESSKLGTEFSTKSVSNIRDLNRNMLISFGFLYTATKTEMRHDIIKFVLRKGHIFKMDRIYLKIKSLLGINTTFA